LNWLRTALDASKVGDRDKLDGFRRLESFVRAAETQLEPEADFDSVITHEETISPSLGGPAVFDDRPRQRSLF
jgi:uncharacterized protein